MLSVPTRTLFCDLLLAIGQKEKQLEIVRQVLCEQKDFEPYAAFKRIDRLNQGYLTAEDVKKFLNDNDVETELNQIQHYIRHYSKKHPG